MDVEREGSSPASGRVDADKPSYAVRVGDQVTVVPRGTNLRKALLRAGHTPYNRGARWLNCHGMGTCGTCAVRVTGALSPPTRRERWRLGFPPHDRAAGLRLACQCRVEGDLVIEKFAGFWGQRVDEGEGARGADLEPPS